MRMKKQALPEAGELLPLQKMNIYAEYILPYINSAQKGDELLFISPSTFFGFYSLGAYNFQQICKALRSARDERGVEIKLIIDVHDSFTAKAAEGLLTFLVDGREIKHLEGNVYIYYIMVYSKQGKSRHVEFISEEPIQRQYLPGIQIRPFGGIKGQPLEEMSDQEAKAVREAFYQIWDRSAVPVGNIIARYSPIYQARRYLTLFQSLTYIAVLAVGLLTGIAFSLQGQPQPNVVIILLWLIATLGTGVIGTYLSNLFMGKLFR
jgi:hypothetical protein